MSNKPDTEQDGLTDEQYAKFAEWVQICDGATSPLDIWEAAIASVQPRIDALNKRIMELEGMNDGLL